jgi:hypothetical protein
MHRSGTSAITRILNLMGADLPKQLVGALPGNEAGHWEPKRLVLLHDQMLAEAGSSWRDLRPLDLAQLAADRVAYYKSMIRSIIQDEFGNANVFVLKDPRICRFIPIYRAVLTELGIRIQPFIMIRNPLEVSASLLVRNKMPNSHSLLLWLRHSLDAEKHTRDIDRVFLNYDQIVSNVRGVIALLQGSLDQYLPLYSNQQDINDQIVRFVRQDLRHHESSSDDINRNALTKTWINQAYLALRTLTTSGDQTLVFAQLDRISDEFNRSSPLLDKLASDIDDLRTRNEQAEDDMQNLKNTIEQLHDQIRWTSLQHSRAIQITSEQYARAIQESTDRYTRELAGLQRIDYVSRLPPEFTGLRRWLSNRSERHRRFVEDYHKIAASPLFDRDWYLQNNPDVAAAKMDAALHYLQRGGREGRAPGPYFQANAYLKTNPTVAATGENPLLHFLRTLEMARSYGTESGPRGGQ